MSRVRKLEGLEKIIWDEQEKTLQQGFKTTADIVCLIANHRWYKDADDIHFRFYQIIPSNYSRMTKEQVKIVKAAWDETHHILSWVHAKWPTRLRQSTLDSALYYACPYGSVTWDECRDACLRVYNDWDNRFKIIEAFVNGDEW